ncbi:MAG: lipoyl(octanoyl) transferase [Kiritimatiellia bacterium]
MDTNSLRIRDLGLQPYEKIWQAMSRFTNERDDTTIDELWLVEHEPVYTQGQAGKPEHILQASDIPIVKSDRGGQVTYHGPGQLILYPLINLRRRHMGVRDMVTLLEELVVQWLSTHAVVAYARADAPGVYIKKNENDAKIASLGLRIRRGCCFHGVGINIDMDLSPFQNINPCGYEGMLMTQLSEQLDTSSQPSSRQIKDELIGLFAQKIAAAQLDYNAEI